MAGFTPLDIREAVAAARDAAQGVGVQGELLEAS